MGRPEDSELLERMFSDYPELRDAYEHRVYIDKGTYKAPMMVVVCPECGKASLRKLSDIKTGYKSTGKIRVCSSCKGKVLHRFYVENDEARKNLSDKVGSYFRLHPEECKERNRKTQEFYKENPDKNIARVQGLLSPESQRKSYETALKNGTFLMSYWEKQINEEYGGEHAPVGKYHFKYELDCYWPDKKLAIEIDDKTHRESMLKTPKTKSIGYHEDKDKYFSQYGIKILHLTTNPDGPRREGYDNWRQLVEAFLDGSFEGPLIMLDDEYYGDIVYR